jgi:hypothetical protein
VYSLYYQLKRCLPHIIRLFLPTNKKFVNQILMLWLKKMDFCNLLWATKATSNSIAMRTRGNEKEHRLICVS